MRRALTLLLFTISALAVLADPGSAGLTARTDPDDTRTRPDIRKIWTDRGNGVFVEIATWDHLSPRESFNILLDTRGSNAYDRVIELGFGIQKGCQVSHLDSNGTLGAPIGYRHAHRPGGRRISCRFPSGWLDIHKLVRFKVRSGIFSSRINPDDVAPNHGRYVRL